MALAWQATDRNSSFLRSPHDPCHRAPSSARILIPVITPYCWTLVNCYISFFKRRIFLIGVCYSLSSVKLQIYYMFPSSTPMMSVYRKAVQYFFLTSSWHQSEYFVLYLSGGSGKSHNYREYKDCIQSDWNVFLELSSCSQPALKPAAKNRSESRANTTCILENIPYTKHDLRQQT